MCFLYGCCLRVMRRNDWVGGLGVRAFYRGCYFGYHQLRGEEAASRMMSRDFLRFTGW